VAGELQPLRFAAGEGGHRLAEAQVVEAHVGERLQARENFGVVLEEHHRLGHCHLQRIGDALARRATSRISGR